MIHVVPALLLYLLGLLQSAVYVSTLVDDGERIPRPVRWLLVVAWPAFMAVLAGSLLVESLRAAWRWCCR